MIVLFMCKLKFYFDVTVVFEVCSVWQTIVSSLVCNEATELIEVAITGQ